MTEILFRCQHLNDINIRNNLLTEIGEKKLLIDTLYEYTLLNYIPCLLNQNSLKYLKPVIKLDPVSMVVTCKLQFPYN